MMFLLNKNLIDYSIKYQLFKEWRLSEKADGT